MTDRPAAPASQSDSLRQEPAPPPPLKQTAPAPVDRFILASQQALSRQAAMAEGAARALAEQSLESPLASLPLKDALACRADTPLAQALSAMHQRRVGAIVVVDDGQAPVGILTRHDILGRITLPQRPLAEPISAVMSAPAHTLTTDHSLQDAALLMSRHGMRHVPLTSGGRLVNIVSERDLFALQRLSLGQLGRSLRAARDPAALQPLACQIRRLAGQLLGQGVQARQLTELISHLNDLLTERLVVLLADRHRLDLQHACWLAFGSEGRSEQTVATDQDNGLVIASDDPARDRPAWLALAGDVNQALADCGYPLCLGGVMACNPECCLSAAEWQQRFAHWIAHGAPQDLLQASIYFDLRALAGQRALAEPLRQSLQQQAQATPRFIKQLADNLLARQAPLNWRGAIATTASGGRALLDLKLQGTAIFVDAARLYALAQGLAHTGTRDRLLAAAPAIGVAAAEAEGWVSAFEFLQRLRLQVQLPWAQADDHGSAAGPGAPAMPVNPNLIDVNTLNDIDHRMLKESLRLARRLQQRIALDYRR